MKLIWTKAGITRKENGEYTVVWKCRERPMTIESRYLWTFTPRGYTLKPWYFLLQGWDGKEEWFTKICLAKQAAQHLEDHGMVEEIDGWEDEE